MSQVASSKKKKQKTTELAESPAMAAEGASDVSMGSEPTASEPTPASARISQMLGDDDDGGFTEELPSLPFVHDYENGKYYYVRKCYEEYYQIVMEMLNAGKKFVTVTGTPGELHDCYSIHLHGGGIGKSVFYAYFFQRFRKEVGDTCIIAMSFVNDRIAGATVFEDDGKSEELKFPSTLEADIDMAWKMAHTQGKKVLFLCDGPPESVRSPMVVFTSPNAKWLNAMRKNNSTLYMPLWTCKELQEAAFALGLAESSNITDVAVEARFNTFGGVARECFLTTQFLVNKARSELVTEIKKISNPGELKNLCDGRSNRNDCHRLLHYVPDESTMLPETQLASPFVVEKLAQHMLEGVENDRDRLRTELKGIPQGASLRGWLFETGVHEGLQRGCKLQARLLQDNDTPGNSDINDVQLEQTFEIAESPQPDEFKLKDLSPAAAMRGPYHKPESDQFESIDGFYLPKMDSTEVTAPQLVVWNAINLLILFQITISKTHPVNASGIISVLKKLGLLKAVKSNPRQAALLFVVPEDIAACYKRQEIVPEATEDGPVLAVKGIGPQAVKKLAKFNIHTIKELKAAIVAKTLPAKTIQPQALTNLQDMRDKSYSEAMAKIPQYVFSFSRADQAASD
ncbi:hypothetical protein PHYPSEUDO_006664 [Phytophthora pseudosyringae]|uniref:Uncharacterized protein n=1 Tax=Phytophthora pseudosyringae TaxID=221518 RepID=A0A8T1WA10_9STRA|nr:hypothetical protein PHYPSEUDO_006664 [Phytophthora pseudosyringae]